MARSSCATPSPGDLRHRRQRRPHRCHHHQGRRHRMEPASLAIATKTTRVSVARAMRRQLHVLIPEAGGYDDLTRNGRCDDGSPRALGRRRASRHRLHRLRGAVLATAATTAARSAAKPAHDSKTATASVAAAAPPPPPSPPPLPPSPPPSPSVRHHRALRHPRRRRPVPPAPPPVFEWHSCASRHFDPANSGVNNELPTYEDAYSTATSFTLAPRCLTCANSPRQNEVLASFCRSAILSSPIS